MNTPQNNSQPKSLQPESFKEDALWEQLGQRPQAQVPDELQGRILRTIAQQEQAKQQRLSSFSLFSAFRLHPALASACALAILAVLGVSFLAIYSLQSPKNSPHSSMGFAQSNPVPSNGGVLNADTHTDTHKGEAQKPNLNEEELRWLSGLNEQVPKLEQNTKLSSVEERILAWEPFLAVDPLIAYVEWSDVQRGNLPNSELLAYEMLF